MTAFAAIDFEGGFNTAFQEGIALLPKIGYFLLILIVGLILAKFVQKVLTKVLQKVGFDGLVERGGVKKALSKSKYDAAAILARIVYYFIFLLVLSAAFGVFGADNPVSIFLADIISFLPKLFVAILIVVIAAAVAAAVKELVTSTLGGLSYGATLANAVSVFVLAVGVFAALDQLEIAPLIVTGIFYALVALIVLPLIIAFGVGGIEPARATILNMRDKATQKQQEVQDHVQAQQDDEDDDVPAVPARRTRATSTRAATRTTAVRRRPTA